MAANDQGIQLSVVVPGAEPFLLPGGDTGCLLVHGFTSMPEEMRWLGDFLVRQGHTVLGVRLAGHATHPRDLARVRWRDWISSLEDGLALLRGLTRQVVVIGQSMGGVVALLAAARYPLAGVVAISTPCQLLPVRLRFALRWLRWLRPWVRKSAVSAHPTLGVRREADYPAYAGFPSRIVLELQGLLAAMCAALPAVEIPVLLIHSRDDASVAPGDMERISRQLGTPDKQVQWLEGYDHSVVRDQRRMAVFPIIDRFVRRVTGTGSGES